MTKIEGVCACGGSGSEVTEYQYDANLNITKITDALLRETSFTYDENGNRLTQTDPLGTQRWTYNSLGQVLTYQDRMDQSTANNTVVNTYDTSGNLLTTTNALGRTTTLTYTPAGQLATVTDARSNTTSLTYDTQGRLTQVTDANNKNTAFAYDARARLTSTTNALNQTTSFEYDLNNRLNKIIFPDANFVSRTFDLAGRMITATDARGNTTTFAYDAAYRLTGVTDPLGHTRTFGYDLMSNLTAQTDALGNVTNFEYDDFNRLKKVIYPEASAGATRLEESVTYDQLGNVKTRVDTAGRTTAYDYDTSNRLIKITDPLTNLTQFEYNARSQMTKLKDALNQEYIYTYDPLGRVLSQARAGSTETFEYDAVGNRTKRTDFNGAVTNYTYDPLNRLVEKASGMTVDSTFTYDDLSRLVSAANSVGTVAFTYDNRGRVASETDVFGHVLEYSYDGDGNRTQLKLDGNVQTGYAYDVASRLTTLTDEAGHNFTFGYDAANKLVSKAMPNGITTTYDYDGMSRLKRLKHQGPSSVLEDDQYSYNTASQISQIAGLTNVRNFSYDNLNRLTAATDGVVNESYAYDGVGNRTASHLSTAYTFDPFNRIKSTATTTYGTDANGNITGKSDGVTTWSYSWDLDNRMVNASDGGLNNFVSYEYDALGRRVRRTQGVLYNQTYDLFTYDGNDVVYEEGTKPGVLGGTVTSTYAYQNGLSIDDKLKVRSGGQDQYFLRDHLGSTTALADAAGAVTQSRVYDSFGFGAPFGKPGTRYQFTGREYDNTTGLYYYRARMYDPQLGRFISEDPIGFAGQQVNLYAYVANMPVDFVDPLGLFPSIWPFDYHQQIGSEALAGLASPRQIQSINYANGDFDRRTQDPIYAPYHAMRRPGQSVAEARTEANEFVRNKICLAREYASRGWNTDAMHELAKAIHTVQDAESPAHAGFQEAWPTDILSMVTNSPHYARESVFVGSEMKRAEEQTRKVWRYFNGTPMPADFFTR